MNPETTKNESIGHQANAYELSEQDLEQVAGGVSAGPIEPTHKTIAITNEPTPGVSNPGI
jgi:hypothetical protein